MDTAAFKKYAKIILPVMIALLSVFVLAQYASSAGTHAKTLAALEKKKTTVMELTAASAGASAAITVIPGDTATPIAQELADLSSYFLIVICAIYLEKFLVTITGYATFAWIIPAACASYLAYVCLQNSALRRFAFRLAAFGLAIFLVVPASVKVSDKIEETYEASIRETVDSAKQAAEELEGVSEETEETEKEGFFSGIVSRVQDRVTGATENVKTVLNRFVEALAVMIVTSCVIPILVLLLFLKIIKLFLNLFSSTETNPGEKSTASPPLPKLPATEK